MWPGPSGRSGGRALRAVLDTNVWVSGLILPNRIPGQVPLALRHRRFDAVASWELAEEVVEVLRRPRITRYGITEDDVADVLVLMAPLLPGVEANVEIRDPDDAKVVGAALAGRADAIVTGDRDILDDPDLRRWLEHHGVEVLTPAEFLRALNG